MPPPPLPTPPCQVAIFIVPLVVLVGWAMGAPFTLDFDPFCVLLLLGERSLGRIVGGLVGRKARVWPRRFSAGRCGAHQPRRSTPLSREGTAACGASIYSCPFNFDCPSKYCCPSHPRAVSVILAYFITSDGASNWLLGLQLITTYFLIGFVFFLEKEAPRPGPKPAASPPPAGPL